MSTQISRVSWLRPWVAFLVLGSVTFMLLPSYGDAQPTENVHKAMTLLKAKAAKLGPAEIKGQDSGAGNTAPALYFGKTKMNDNFALVDAVQQQMGGVATFFVKSGDGFVRVSTNVKKDDGSRAIGTMLDPNGRAFAAIKNGEAFYGEADILGKAYVTGYEPLRSSDGKVIGIYFVALVSDTFEVGFVKRLSFIGFHEIFQC